MDEWYYNLVAYAVFVAAWIVLFVLAYYLIPRKWRHQSLWWRLPVTISALNIIIGIPAFKYAPLWESTFGLFYLFINFPASALLMTYGRYFAWLDWFRESVVYVGASIVVWIIISGVVGWLIDLRRKRRAKIQVTQPASRNLPACWGHPDGRGVDLLELSA
jgi:hypothetical protein